MNVPANDFGRLWREVGDLAMKATRRVGESGWFILGDEVARFERSLAEAWPLPHAVGVASGLDAIEISLRVLGLKPGERVLTTPLSAFATTLAIVRAQGVPVFADVDSSGLLDLDRCADVLSADRSIRFLVPVHLYGRSIDLRRLAALKERFGLRVVEDCAQSIGARSAGACTGSVGELAATSFYPTKNLGAFGDGGAVLTRDADLAAHARALRHYGQSAQYVHDELGLNSRLDELHAAILRDATLPSLHRWNEMRRATAARYLAEIRHPQIELPAPDLEACWHLFPVLVAADRRPAFLQHLRDAGVGAAVHYPRIIPEQKAMAGLTAPGAGGEFVQARRFASCEVSLPVHPFLSGDEISHVVGACNGWRPA